MSFNREIHKGSVPELGQRGLTQDQVHYASWVQIPLLPFACLAQSVERKTFNLVVVGSSPTAGTRLITLSNSGEKGSLVIVSPWYQRGYPSLVNGARLKIECFMLRGFKSHSTHLSL